MLRARGGQLVAQLIDGAVEPLRRQLIPGVVLESPHQLLHFDEHFKCHVRHQSHGGGHAESRPHSTIHEPPPRTATPIVLQVDEPFITTEDIHARDHIATAARQRQRLISSTNSITPLFWIPNGVLRFHAEKVTGTDPVASSDDPV